MRTQRSNVTWLTTSAMFQPGTVQRYLGAGAAVLAVALFSTGLMPHQASARTAPDLEPMRSLAGSYLAGRFARSQHDTDQAAFFYRSALFRDPDNEVLLEQGFLMEASEGNWSGAEMLAKRLVDIQPTHRMARMFLGLVEFKAGNYDNAEENFKKADTGPIGELTSAIARAWIRLAEGNTKKALAILQMPKQAEWAQFYLRYHRGLIADIGGQTKQAKRAFNRVFQQDSRTLRTALAYARHLAHSGDTKGARDVLKAHLKQTQGEGHPLARDLYSSLEKPGDVSLLISNSTEGMAEVFYGLGEALTGEGGVSIGILYLQMALYLEPKHPFALAALANAHETTKRYSAAIDVYEVIPNGTPLQSAIDIRKAFNLNSLDRVDEAKDLLLEVASRDPTDVKPLDALGNILRSRKRYAEAILYYNKAIDLIGKPERQHWAFFYSRGTCYERVKDWPKAEKDLEKALELYPDQPLALNYLGYSWIDQGIHLKKGLKLIEKAVALKPDDGYIVDSLGWAHFKLGNFEKAAAYLERAVELRPEDPVLNDHLGDALWHVGRIREARFQWDQALTLGPEPEDQTKIEAKLAKGLSGKRQARAETGITSDAGPGQAAPEVKSGDGDAGTIPLPTRRNSN